MDLSKLDKAARVECVSCPRFDQPYVPPTIVKGSKLMAIAEAPAKEEVEAGQVLVGPAGRMLSRIFEQAEVERGEVSLANVVACYGAPVRDKKGYLAYPEPSVEEIEACSGVLEQAIAEAGPRVLLALGGSATRRLVGERKILKWRGSTLNAPERVSLGKKTVLGPVVFKSGKRKGELKPRKVESELTQASAAGLPVVLTLHPSMCLPDKLGPVSGLTMVVPDVKRARLLSEGSKLIEVGKEILSHVEDASLAGIILESSKLTVCDVETDGKFGKLTLVGLAPSKDYAVTFRPDARLFLMLAKAFVEKDRLVIGHNFGSYDTKVLERRDERANWPGLSIEARLFDTMHAIRFERPDLNEIIKPAALDRACSRLAGYSYYNWKEAFRDGVNESIAYYCAMDCAWTFALYEEYRARLERSNRLKHFEQDMMPALKVLTKLEQVGIQIDRAKLEELASRQKGVVEALDEAWNTETGGVNYRSQAGAGELRTYFYKTLKLPVQFTGRGKTRRETLDEEACEKLARLRPDVKALQILVSLRHANKILSTYLTLELDSTGRFHPSYNLTGAETGRFSGDMQQVPRTAKACVALVEGCVCHRVREIYVADEGDEGLACSDWCLALGTRILTDDLRWIPIEQLNVGQAIIGFPEKLSERGHHKYERAWVTSLGEAELECYEIETDRGTVVASANHKWLVRMKGKKLTFSGCSRLWAETKDIHVGDTLAYMGQTWTGEELTEYERGWLAGILDGEGWISKRRRCRVGLGVAQNAGNVLEEIKRLCRKLDIPFHNTVRKSGGGKLSSIRFNLHESRMVMGITRPIRLMEKADNLWEGSTTFSSRRQPAKVLRVTPVGVKRVITIGTSSKTLVAEGFLTHNSQIEFRLWGVLAHDPAIAAVYAEGGPGDIHEWSAKMLGTERKIAKHMTHASMFGAGAEKVASFAGCSVSQAQRMLDSLQAQFAVTQRYKSKLVQEAQRFGFVTNPFGRRIYFPVDYKGRVKPTEIYASMPQSTAACMMTRALVRSWDAGLKVRLSVHDEIGISARVPADASLLQAVMQEPYEELHFSNPAEVKIGRNWSESKA